MPQTTTWKPRNGPARLEQPRTVPVIVRGFLHAPRGPVRSLHPAPTWVRGLGLVPHRFVLEAVRPARLAPVVPRTAGAFLCPQTGAYAVLQRCKARAGPSRRGTAGGTRDDVTYKGPSLCSLYFYKRYLGTPSVRHIVTPSVRRESVPPYYSRGREATSPDGDATEAKPAREFVPPYYSQRERDYRAPTQRGKPAD